MRKLSKKISMLMVLAMLVSLFSGIVSASAASAWSFASSKYDVDVKETITMDKNEYADFDLLKEDVEVTKATYTVKWASSDEDVVWVNAKTGQLRADKFGVAEAGDKAKISATFTNVKTKKSATRYFYIEIASEAKYEIAVNFGDEALVVGQKYDLAATVKADGKEVKADVAFSIDGKAINAAYTPAAAGEVTIVAVATVDGKEVAKAETKVVVAEAKTGIVSVKQTSLTKALVVLGSETAAKAVADSKNVAVTFTAENSSYEIDALVKSVAVDGTDKTAVVVEMYDQFVPKYTYKFTVGADSKGFVAVTANEEDIASIIVVTWNKFIEDTYNNLGVLAFNAQGVEITGSKAVDEYLGYYLSWELAEAESGICDLNNNQLKFYEANKSAVVKAELNMGYNDDGTEKIALTAMGKVVSVPRYTDKPAEGFVISNSVNFGNAGHWDYNYTLGTIEMIADEFPGYLTAKYTQVEEKFGWASYTTQYVYQGADNGLDSKTGYTYRSSNEEVCFIDAETGYVYPSKAGTARLYVLNPDGVAIGSVTVKVHASQTLKNFTVGLSKNKLSVDTVDETDKIVLTVAAQDQLGRAYDFTSAASISYEIEVSNDLGGKLVIDNANFATNYNGGWVCDITAAADAVSDTAKSVSIIVSAWDADDTDKTRVITRKVSFKVKDVNQSENGKVTLVSNDKTVDTKLNQWGADAYAVDLAAARTADGFFLDSISYTLVNNGAASVATGAYTLVVTKNNGTVPAEDWALIGGKFTPVKNSDDGTNEVLKAGKGTYRFKLYVGTGSAATHVDSLTVTVKDTTEKYTTVRNATTLASYHATIDASNLKDYVKLYRDGVLYDDWKYSVDSIEINDAKSIDGETIYIQEVTYKLNAFNAYFAYTSWERNTWVDTITVPVNMKFTILD